MLRKEQLLTIAVLILSLLLMNGCQNASMNESSGKSDSPAPAAEGKPIAAQPNNDPVTLNLFAGQPFSSDEDWNRFLIDPVKKKYPYITVTVFKPAAKQQLPDLIAAGTDIDLWTQWTGAIGNNIVQLDLQEDITPLIKKDNIDLAQFDPIALTAVKTQSNNGQQLYGLPYFVQLNALYYNKDIFDKFGVTYPIDGMTWEDTIELAKKVTRTDNGVQYFGLDPEHVSRLSFPLSLPLVDWQTNRAIVNNDKWKRVFDLAKSIYTIPGNMPDNVKAGAINRFIEEKNMSMLPTINILDRAKSLSDNGVNWDLAQYPSYKEQPNKYGLTDIHTIGITKTSKHQDAAMKVVEVLTSNEVQLQMARQRPGLSSLTNPEMKTQFGAEVPYLQGKHLQSIFKSQPVPAPHFSIYYKDAQKSLLKYSEQYIKGQIDVNTALRMADDEINQTVAALLPK